MRFGVILFCMLMLTSARAADSDFKFANDAQYVTFQHVLQETRCLVCRNQDLLDSHAPLAMDLKKKVYKLVQEKYSEAEIKSYLVERYGEFILYKPPLNAKTYLLWFGPYIFLGLGVLALGLFVYKNKGLQV
ncbi:MAG: hypothetical protein A3F18_04480 [Legionellales bacterium RIFCSPHIGHO2_12_FULL_37_14]|nr:MAG: hypothetical protein A3F18_04480 [Legionellales bacterium RIFCSPHIGHO2_12_FULL_37_14]